MRSKRPQVTISDVRRANPTWFGKGNARFFGDSRYWLRTGRSGRRYLLRYTSAWSDMFGRPKRWRFAINAIEDDLKIGQLIDGPEGGTLFFSRREEINAWLREA